MQPREEAAGHTIEARQDKLRVMERLTWQLEGILHVVEDRLHHMPGVGHDDLDILLGVAVEKVQALNALVAGLYDNKGEVTP